MSKKFLGILAFVSFLLSGAYADDILAIVSNGQLTSKSAGVKELSLEERMQVKGGLDALILKPSFITDRYGNKITMYQYFPLVLTDVEQRNGIVEIKGSGDTRMSQLTQNYLDFKWLTVVNPSVEVPVVLMQYNFKTKQWQSQVSALNIKYGSIRSINQSFPLIQKIMKSELYTLIKERASQYRWSSL